jgi:hypothetical protein
MHYYCEAKGIFVARKLEAEQLKQSVSKGPWQVTQE